MNCPFCKDKPCLRPHCPYTKNKKSKKIQRYVADLRDWGIIPDANQKYCVATHLALQLSGLA